MIDAMEHEERALRRRLLFRILKGFDFDISSLCHEPIRSPMHQLAATPTCDHFEFSFDRSVRASDCNSESDQVTRRTTLACAQAERLCGADAVKEMTGGPGDVTAPAVK